MHVENHVTVIGDHAVAVHRVAAELDDLPGHMAAGHGNDLHRQRKLAEGGYQLALIGNADEGAGYRRDDLFPGQGRATALDQLQMLVGLIGTIHIEIQSGHAVQVVDRNAVLLQAFGGGLGAGDRAIEVALVSGQSINEMVGGGAGADADDAPVFQLRQQNIHCGLGNCLLEFVLGHAGYLCCRCTGEQSGDYTARRGHRVVGAWLIRLDWRFYITKPKT